METTKGMFHVFSHDCHGGKVPFLLDPVYLAHSYFLCEFLGQNLHRKVGVAVPHTYRGGVFGSGLRYQEHADSRFCQCLEYSVVDTYHADHSETLDRYQAGVIDGRDALDGPGVVARFRISRDECSRRSRIERIFDLYRNILVVGREYCRGIDDLCSEVAQFHRLHECEVLDSIGIADDFRIGRHEAVDVGPDFEGVGVEDRSKDGSRIVRASASEIGDISVGRIGTDESRDYGYVRQFGEFLENEPFGLGEIHDVLVEIRFRLDEFARVVQHGVSDGPADYDGRQAFTVADNGIGRLRGQVLDQEYSLVDVRQFPEHGPESGLHFRKHLRDDCIFSLPEMSFTDGFQLLFVGRIPFRSRFRCPYKLVSDASESGNHHYYVICAGFDYVFCLKEACG